MLEELTEEEFENFSKNHPLRNFMETIEIGNLRRKNGWSVKYLGLKEDNELVGATMLLSRKRHFNKYEFYALRGPLLDYSNDRQVEIFLKGLKDYVKNNKGYCLRLDPYLPIRRYENDKELEVPKTNIMKILKKLEFKKNDIQEEVTSMYVLDLEGKTEEDILKNMKPNARNIIRKTIKTGIEVVSLKKEELDEFYQIMIETGKRKGFAVRDISYYQNMYDLFSAKNEVKFLVTRLNLDKYISLLNEEIEEDILKKNALSVSKCNDGKRKSLDENIDSLKKKVDIAKKQREEAKKSVITLAGSMFIMTDPEIVYLSSGNYEKYLMYNSQYLIQWEMIKYAIEQGYKRYNFYGTPTTNKEDKTYGIYQFKASFHGYMEELLGEYITATSKTYYIIDFIQKLKES